MNRPGITTGMAASRPLHLFGLAVASVGLLAACGDSAGSGVPGGAAQGGSSTGGATLGSGGAAGGHTGLGGGSIVGTGGSSVPGSGGSSVTPQGGAVGTTGGQGGAGGTAGPMAGQAGAALGGQAGSDSGSGGKAASGGAGIAGKGGGASSGGSGGSSSGGKGGASLGGTTGQGGANGKGGTAPGGAGGSGGVPQGGAGGKGGASQGGAGGSGPSGCKGGKVVQFVYFVESDQTYNESHRNDIEKQAFKFQNYWFEQLGGVTFYLSEPVVEVIRADHPAAWYLDTPDGIHSDSRWYRLGNIKNEVYRKLGIRDNDPNWRVVNYPTTRHDGRVGGNFGGAWMDGDDLTCIATNGVNYPYPPPGDSPAHCMGHVAHEFGHLLGLDHEGPQDGCMQYGFYQPLGGPMCDFGAANIAKIKAHSRNVGWFEARPGQTCAPP